MSLVVEFQISGDPLQLPDAAAAVPDVTIEFERWKHSPEQVHWYLWTEGEDLDRVTRAFEDLPNCLGTTIINDGAGRRLYRVSMEPTIDRAPERIFQNGTVTGGFIRPHCIHLTGRTSGREVIIETTEYLRKRDIDINVLRISQASNDSTNQRLTDSQFEALVTAYEMGYFDETEHVTQAEIADELGISRSAFSSRLRRAQEELVEKEISFVE